MMTRREITAWILAGLAALAVVGLLVDTPQHDSPPAQRPQVRQPDTDLAPNTVRGGADTGDQGSETVQTDDACPPQRVDTETCLADAEVRKRIEQSVADSITERSISAQRDERKRNEQRRAKVRALVAERLALDGEEMANILDTVCAVRRLQQQGLERALAEPTLADDQLVRVADERTTQLRRLEFELGKDRYGELRAIGGIGLLGQAAECQD